VRYSVNVTLSPGDITPGQHQALRRTGGYAEVAAALRKLGYPGEWHNTGGVFGLFIKDLRTQAELKREVKRLRALSYRRLLGDVGRTTTR